jgi:hypothetical protein
VKTSLGETADAVKRITEYGIHQLLVKEDHSVYHLELVFPKPGELVVYVEGDVFDGYEYSTLEEFIDNWDESWYGKLCYIENMRNN